MNYREANVPCVGEEVEHVEELLKAIMDRMGF